MRSVPRTPVANSGGDSFGWELWYFTSTRQIKSPSSWQTNFWGYESLISEKWASNASTCHPSLHPPGLHPPGVFAAQKHYCNKVSPETPSILEFKRRLDIRYYKTPHKTPPHWPPSQSLLTLTLAKISAKRSSSLVSTRQISSAFAPPRSLNAPSSHEWENHNVWIVNVTFNKTNIAPKNGGFQ